jgi:FkbM family methyltransferase
MLRRMPDFWIETRNIYAQNELTLPSNAVFYHRKRWIYTPDDLLVYRVWENHCRAYYIRWEVEQFMKLAQGCARLLDAGSSAGIYSAIFTDCCQSTPTVHSVEPDPRSFGLLEQTRKLNATRRPGCNWQLRNCALGDTDGTWEFCSSGFGAERGEGLPTRKSVFDASADEVQQFSVPVRTLATYCAEADFVPDIIKMDVESYEHEVILSSREFLTRHRPRIFLELHCEKLRERQKDPRAIVSCLTDLGYRIEDSKDSRKWPGMPVAHLSLRPPG